ncbi:carboxypeptidase B-like [Uranotaenia lowii]|uniref:carboxypeptidase B-like n=1 Tax=Uranotaenia lowii TaxID=190385 RepID=UPI002478372C|nr:carboxypeptidase B-like [Uranotaenia lowii]
MIVAKVGIVLLTWTALVVARKTYSGYKVFEIQQHNEEEVNAIQDLYRNHENLDFWHLSRIVGDTVRVMVPPQDQPAFTNFTITKGLELRELPIDLQKVNKQIIEVTTKQTNITELITKKFLRHGEINQYLSELAAKYPSRVRVEEIGKSTEGRSMKTITIAAKDNPEQKPVVFVDAGIHAREWIAPSTALYIIQQLVEYPDRNDAALLEKFNWIILPVVNPDGYEYSHTDDRLWRKTRSTSFTSFICQGTDANRNFEYHWAEVGASDNQCSEIFHGPEAFSEPETRAIRNELLRLKGRCQFYLTLHSHGRYLLYPWGWTDSLPETVDDLNDVAKAGYEAILSAIGLKYTFGTSTNVLYAAAGGSDDWAFAEAAVPISITMELPSGGASGFDPAPELIEAYVMEGWVGIKAMALKVAEKYPVLVTNGSEKFSCFSVLLFLTGLVISVLRKP